MRSKLATLAALGAVVIGIVLAPGARGASPVPVVVVEGDGFGHGVGMAQDGALWMGRSGATRQAILGHFYPGTQFGRGTGAVRVAVLTDTDADVVLVFPNGGEVRSPRAGPQQPGFPMAMSPGEAVRVRHGGRYRVERIGVRAAAIGPAQVVPLPTTPPAGGDPSTSSSSSTTTTTAPVTTVPGQPPGSPSTTAPPAGASGATVVESDNSIWAVPPAEGTIGVPDRRARYRGAVEATAGSGPLRLVNEVDVEQYLRGMGEVRDPSWPAASLESQAVVARTYALRAMRAAGELCDTQACQVYLGQQAEYGAMDRAVRATAGQVLLYRGAFASTVYSANGAGFSATPAEGFGTPDAAHPYLRAAPYETKSPTPWTVRIALNDLARRLGYPGDLSDVRVSATGPSGRATKVVLEGSAGARELPALTFDNALGLRSTKWKVRLEVAEPPPPPPEEALIQALPEEVTTTTSTTLQPRRAAAGAGTTRRPSPLLGLGFLVGGGALLAASARRGRPSAP